MPQLFKCDLYGTRVSCSAYRYVVTVMHAANLALQCTGAQRQLLRLNPSFSIMEDKGSSTRDFLTCENHCCRIWANEFLEHQGFAHMQ